MTAFSRSVIIALGAGVAGLSLGLLLGDGARKKAEAITDAEAIMVVVAEPVDESELIDALRELLQDHGATQVVVTEEGPDHHSAEPHLVVLSRWPDLDSAQATLRAPDYLALTRNEGLGPAIIDVVVAPALNGEPGR